MSTTIANLPKAGSLYDNHLMIVEEVSNGTSVETQKTTLQDLYEWLNNALSNVYTQSSQIQVIGSNIDREVNDVTNTVIFHFVLPNYEPKTYYEGEIVAYKDCIYQCINDTQSAQIDDINWKRMGYNPGKYITIDEDNIISAAGVKTWQSGEEYAIGDCVIRNKQLYQCLIANTDTTWDKNKWQNIGEGNGILIYEDRKYYDVGAIIIKDDMLYKRVSGGADISWTPSNWICISSGIYSIVYIKYSYDVPTRDSEMSDIPNRYIGICNGSNTNVPRHYTDYVWYKIKGEDGTVNVEANCIVIEATLDKDDWSNTIPHTITVLDSTVTEDMYPIVDIVLSADTSLWGDEKENFVLIDKAVATNGAITFYCGSDKPAIDLNIKVRFNGDVNENSFARRDELQSFETSTQSAFVAMGARVTDNTNDIEELQAGIQLIIDKLEEFNMVDYKYWLVLGEVTTEYDSLAEVLASTDYPVLLNNERSAAYAAYISSEIATAIKNNLTYLRQALLCDNSDMFFNSSYDYDEHIEEFTEVNPTVTSGTYQGIVTCSSDRESYGYCGYMAFDGGVDSNDLTVVGEDRHIWSAMGLNQWVQYKYSSPRNLYKVKIYGIRDNAPLSVEVQGSNDGENFTTIDVKNLNIVLDAQNYTEFICTCNTKYMYYRFVINDNYYSGTCAVGEIEIYTFVEDNNG